jgi:signal transduction histidine kinase
VLAQADPAAPCDERSRSDQRDRGSLMRRLWASRWPEAAWTAFAVGNLVWMVLVPSQSLLPFHFIWISLLLLYGLGYRTYTRTLTWFLLVPVMAGAALLFLDARIRALQPYDDLIELPVMVVMVFAITRHTSRRAAAMAALDKMSQHNTLLLERQRAFVQNASHELRTPITVALAHAELLPKAGTNPAAAEDLDIVTDELTRLRRLTDRLLLLATAEQSDRLHPVPTRLTDIMDEALRRWDAVPRKWVAGRHDDTAVLADPTASWWRSTRSWTTPSGSPEKATASSYPCTATASAPGSRSLTPARESLTASSDRSSTGSTPPARTATRPATSGSACRSSARSQKHTRDRSPRRRVRPEARP